MPVKSVTQWRAAVRLVSPSATPGEANPEVSDVSDVIPFLLSR